MDIKNVTVIGAGLMGRQIAMQVALSGYDVICYDVVPAALESAEEFMHSWAEKRVAKGKMTEEAKNDLYAKLTFCGDEKTAAEKADIVMEAVLDIADVKRSVLGSFDKYTPSHTIYASNSSYLVSSTFADAVEDPSKVLNVHFFNPALVMKVVEVVKGPHVSDETYETAYEFVKSIGKTPIRIEKEIYGFVVNRIFSALTREACYLVDQGVASIEDIDTAVKGALGHSMGPLETLDMTGIDLEYSVYMEKFRKSGAMEDRPAACLTERYSRGEYGRKTGKGFYDYTK